MAQNTPEVSLHFLDYWRIIRNRLPIIITVFLLTFITGYVVTVYYMQKIYSASVQIKVEKRDPDVNVYRFDSGFFDPIWFQTQYEIIQSRKILDMVVKNLDLQKVWAKRLFGAEQELPVGQAAGILGGKFLEVLNKRGSNILEIRAFSDIPQEAADIANAVADEYITSRKNDELAKTNRGLESVQKEIDKQKAIVDEARAKVEEIRTRLHIDLSGGSLNDSEMIDAELSRKTTQQDEINAEYTTRLTRYNNLKSLPQDEFINALQALGVEDPNISSLRTQILSSQAELQTVLQTGLDENHPRILARKEQIKQLQEQIHGIVEGRRKAMAIDIEVVKSRKDQIDKEVADLKEKARGEKTQEMAPFREAIREAERQQTILDSLNLRYKQESVDKDVGNEPASIISRAEPSDAPVKPNKTLNFLLSAFAGLGLGLGLAFFIEYLDTSVKTMDDVEKFLDLPVLTVIPDGVSPLNVEGPDSSHAEGYRILRAKLDMAPSASGGRSLTMVSGGPGEGKTTTLFNLAYVCAQSGQSVILVDTDLRRPTLHRLLGMSNEAGMADVFRNRGEAYEFIRPTSIPNLHVISAGNMPSSEFGAFSAVKLREVVADLKLRYDIVLLDAPPVLGISDGSVIAREADITLLVIQHRRYPRDISARARRAVEEAKGNLTGVVLNAVSLKSDQAYYYYSSYGSYYYKNGSSSEEETVKNGSGGENRTKGAVAHRKDQPAGSEDF